MANPTVFTVENLKHFPFWTGSVRNGSSRFPSLADRLLAFEAGLANAASGDVTLTSGCASPVGATDLSGGPTQITIPIANVPAGTTVKTCTLYGVGFGIDVAPTFNASTYQFVASDPVGGDVALTEAFAATDFATEYVLDPEVVLDADSVIVLVLSGLANGTTDIIKGDVVVEFPAA